jgi:redox-sensitive bicupin YhaK (pirin superfamily)
MRVFAYVFEGEAQIGGRDVPLHTLAVLGEGDEVEIVTGEAGARLILVAGRPINEPIVQYGPFVMNTQDEIRQALEDFRGNRLVRRKASVAATH